MGEKGRFARLKLQGMAEKGKIVVRPIGVVHSPLSGFTQSRVKVDFSGTRSVIEVLPEYAEGLLGMEDAVGGTVVVLYRFHRSVTDTMSLLSFPRGDTSRTQRGIFATRSNVRPNFIAFSTATLVEFIKPNKLVVLGLDAIDGSPLIDIKLPGSISLVD